jgi:uncharacterized protein YkwD
MAKPLRQITWAPALLAALVLSACGGGGSEPGVSNSNSSAPKQVPTTSIQEPNAPRVTGDAATDSINWFNFRRQQAGLSALKRNGLIDTAALGHSNYQKINDVITHVQTAGKPGFTGATLADRLKAADYQFTSPLGSAYGEVIASTGDTSGVNAAEDLVAAIYHRFVAFEPMFKEVGAGIATAAGGSTYFTTNFASNGLDAGLPPGGLTVYPFANQQRVPRNFLSDNEAPDPVADRNEVGYPISVHANITATVVVQSFTVKARGGAVLPTQLLARANDVHTPKSAAAIIPLGPLTAGTVYDVQFIGTVDGIGVNRSWSFTTS